MSGLDQTCPFCEITEAAGGYCTSCERTTRPEWVHSKRLSEAQVAARTTSGRNRAKPLVRGPRSAKEGTA